MVSFVTRFDFRASDDGYLPSPLVVAAAVAARTKRIPISVSALLVNLYDPLKLAEEVEVQGRRVQLAPLPFTRPHPFLLYGGGFPAAARRAARLGLGFAPQVADRELRQLYRDECRRLGIEPGMVLMPPAGPGTSGW